ncbi:sterol 3-beta-glucosyltransferase isoform X6 [Primulina eburnea]|uniref:sterol 3-beta-glucosyltransferase isoform X6 n=1 Tax=Primulina eburnea TaxID=1245227 RepID=UPI003C6C1939
MRTKPTAVFMAFGTKGDVYPIAAIAAAFASDQRQYEVAFVTHSAHEVFSILQKLKVHLEAKRITYFPVSSPPVMSYQDTAGSSKVSFSLQKNEIMIKHRQECVSIAEGIFGEDSNMDGDLIIINFFALEGWSLAELFQVRCVVAAPYVVPYSAPSSFERQFQKELPLLYEYLQDAPTGKVGWEDVIHWMWPFFTEDWGHWRSHDLHLSFLPFTDAVTGLPRWHERPLSPLLLLCLTGMDLAKKLLSALITGHQEFSMGYLKNPRAFLKVLENALSITSCRFILFSAGYGPLDAEIKMSAQKLLSPSEQLQLSEDQTCLFGGRLLCFSGDVPYNWLFPRCAAAIHHGGSGSTAAALHAGIPQVICPFILDQFYWAERMFWLGVAPEPLKGTCLVPDKDNDCYIMEAANMLVGAINRALSPEVKLQASQIANRISGEDGVSEAVRLIREEINCTGAAV